MRLYVNDICLDVAEQDIRGKILPFCCFGGHIVLVSVTHYYVVLLSIVHGDDCVID